MEKRKAKKFNIINYNKTQMRKIITSFAFIFSGLLAHAQVPNSSFENWTSGDPDGWETGNSQNAIGITQSNQAHSGSSAARLGVFSVNSTNIGPALSAQYHASTTLPTDSLVFWYKSNFVNSGDCMTIFLTMYQATNAVTFGSGLINTNTSTYTRFAMAAFILQSANIDSVELSFVIGNGTSSPLSLSTYFLLDDANLGTASSSGVHELQNVSGISVFPNPSASFVNFEVQKKSSVEVYALDGSLVLSQIVEKGNVQLNLADLPEGMLMLVVRNDNNLFRQQIIHTR
jgi:hypothetical protein